MSFKNVRYGSQKTVSNHLKLTQIVTLIGKSGSSLLVEIQICMRDTYLHFVFQRYCCTQLNFCIAISKFHEELTNAKGPVYTLTWIFF